MAKTSKASGRTAGIAPLTVPQPHSVHMADRGATFSDEMGHVRFINVSVRSRSKWVNHSTTPHARVV